MKSHGFSIMEPIPLEVPTISYQSIYFDLIMTNLEDKLFYMLPIRVVAKEKSFVFLPLFSTEDTFPNPSFPGSTYFLSSFELIIPSIMEEDEFYYPLTKERFPQVDFKKPTQATVNVYIASMLQPKHIGGFRDAPTWVSPNQLQKTWQQKMLTHVSILRKR